jgi:hypothetical protein
MEKLLRFISKNSQKLLNLFKNPRKNRVENLQESRVDLIEFREFLSSEKLVDFYGYQFLPREAKRGDKFRKAHFISSQVVGIFVIFLAIITTVVYANENLEVATENSCYVAAYISTLMKFLYMFSKSRNLIVEVIEKLDEHFPHLSLDQNSFGVRKHLKELKIILKLVVFAYLFSVTQFSIFNVEVKIYGWIMSKEVEWIPMHVFWFPFDASKPAIFWITQVSVNLLKYSKIKFIFN